MKTTNNSYRPHFNRLLMAFKRCSGINDLAFHLGYQQILIPRPVRKVLAKTNLHRSWLSGFTGLGICSIVELTKSNENHSK